MQMPRRFNTYCPNCDGHHEHEVEKVRSGRPTGMKWDARQRERKSGSVTLVASRKCPVGTNRRRRPT